MKNDGKQKKNQSDGKVYFFPKHVLKFFRAPPQPHSHLKNTLKQTPKKKTLLRKIVDPPPSKENFLDFFLLVIKILVQDFKTFLGVTTKNPF